MAPLVAEIATALAGRNFEVIYVNDGSSDATETELKALQAELDAGITHRMVTLVIAGEDSPDYNTPVLSSGRNVGKLTSPSAGRSPTVDKLIAMACIEADLAEVGRQVEVTLPDGRLVPALVDQFPIYDPEKSRPRS